MSKVFQKRASRLVASLMVVISFVTLLSSIDGEEENYEPYGTTNGLWETIPEENETNGIDWMPSFFWGKKYLSTGDHWTIRGQTNDSTYWNSVYSPYANPTYVAQNPASVAPTITGGGVAPSGTAIPAASTSTAPPITQGSNPAIALNPPTNEGGFTQPVNKVMKFWQNLSLDYTHVCRGSADSGLGIDEINLYSEFSVPCSILPPSTGSDTNSGYLFISPGFSLNLWSGPNSFDMPAQTFDANLALGARPQFTKDFGMEGWVQIGLGSSFKKISSKAIYVRGKITATLGITEDGRFYAHGGIMYLDRNHYKLIPVAGVIWRPNESNIWRLVFPDPQISRHLGKINETDWWGYIQGNIGGGRWLVHEYDDLFNIDYNDYRVGVGVSFGTATRMNGHVELGLNFARELYAYGYAFYKPKTGFYVKAGLSF